MGMVVAAIMRNVIDASQKPLPFNEIGVIGNISLSLFLSMALMSMKLWELVELAGPLSNNINSSNNSNGSICLLYNILYYGKRL